MGVNLKDARVEVEKIIGRGSGYVAVEIPFTPCARHVLDLSQEEARQLRHNYIGTEHLLLGMYQHGEGNSFRVLENLGIDLRVFRSLFIDYFPQANIEQPFVLDLTNLKSIDERLVEALLDFKNDTYEASIDLFVMADSSLAEQAKSAKIDKYIVFSRSIDEYFSRDNDGKKFSFDSDKYLSAVSNSTQNDIDEDIFEEEIIDAAAALHADTNGTCDKAMDDPELIIYKIPSELWPDIQYSDDESTAMQFQYLGSSKQMITFRLIAFSSFDRTYNSELINLTTAMLERVENYIHSLLNSLNEGCTIRIRLDLSDPESYDIHDWDNIAEFINSFGDLLDSFPFALQSFENKPIISDYIDLTDYYLLDAQRREAAKVEQDWKEFLAWLVLLVLALWLFIAAISP